MLTSFIKGIYQKWMSKISNLVERNCRKSFEYYDKLLTKTALTADLMKSILLCIH
jgi:hypothetical protein